MGLRSFNFLGFVLVFLALLWNEIVMVNVWYDSNLFLIAIGAYLLVAIGLALGKFRSPASLTHVHPLNGFSADLKKGAKFVLAGPAVNWFLVISKLNPLAGAYGHS